ncbi:hypothetical protein DSO57_1021889 [Entomophthora muscae]|uniref:Uncharacterized protein n=1 Tax=Entomophthora muscae TaxID=34485 RepID=A0ACC2T3J6_9FUNG|nr:hypothetical protein DSO57_1021889 [Entomophthora muscae]
MNDISILVLKTQELNPSSQKADQTLQTSPGPANQLNHRLKLSPKDNSPNGCQIDANLEPPKTQTYAEVAACLKEVKTKSIFNFTNDHQQHPVFRPEGIVQLNYSDDIVNSGSRKKCCHFYSPEQALPGSAALETPSQDPRTNSAWFANLNPAKIKEAKSQGRCPLLSPSCQTAPGIILPPWSSLWTCALYQVPPNLAYSEYNLETILIANPLASTRSTKYIGREGKRVEIPPLLFKDKYNYLPAYFVPITPPLTPRPDRPLEPTAATKTTSTQLFRVLYITLTGLVDSVVPNSGPWSLLGQSLSYIIKLAPILWWALPASSTAPCPEPPNASAYDWLPKTHASFVLRRWSIFSLHTFFSHSNWARGSSRCWLLDTSALWVQQCTRAQHSLGPFDDG